MTRRESMMSDSESADRQFDALLDASSLGAPHVQAVTQDLGRSDGCGE